MSDKIKLAYVGDSPCINSGFSVVARSILTRLPDDIEIYVLGTMYEHYPESHSYRYYQPVCQHDLMGFGAQMGFIQHVNPDVCLFIGDPGTLRNRYGNLVQSGMMGILPFASYYPLEGAPVSDHIAMQARMVFAPVTYTKWGQSELAKHGIEVDYVYHGFDHGPFRRYDEMYRQRLRHAAGWGDKFAVGMVAMNKRTNRQPAVIEAARILKDRGHDDIVIYLHCQEKGEFFMAGWELGWMLKYYDVEDMVVLKPNQAEHKYIARPHEASPVLDLPEDKDEAMRNLSSFGFIDLLNCFDLYLDPASCHGFNLPAGEAARCGVPVATVDDGFARSEIYGDCAHLMEPNGWDHWHTGAQLPLVSPKCIADTIEMMQQEDQYRQTVADKCKAKFDGLTWQPAADLFADKIHQAAEFGKQVASQL